MTESHRDRVVLITAGVEVPAVNLETGDYKMVKENTDVATTDDATPAYLQALEKQGAAHQNDNFDSSDVAIPQIKLLQGTSSQVTDFDNARSGNFWHTGMDMDLGKDVKFIVCSRRKKFLLQAPLDDGQGVLARSDDAITWDREGSWEVQIDKKTKATWEITDLNVEKSGLAGWGTSDPEDENSPPAATLFYEYLVIMPEHLDLGPAVISLARSAVKKAKKGLNDKIALHGGNGRPMQSVQFEAKSVADQNDSNQEFANWHFTGAGFASEELYNKAVEYGKALGDYKVQEEGNQDDAKTPKADSDEY